MDLFYPATTIFAPAKINLCLHITGKRPDGYHILDSIVAFCSIGDEIQINYSEHFEFYINGPFAHAFSQDENQRNIDSSNLIVKAVKFFAQTLNKPTNFRITLTKNLPLASGIGGGSSDCAAVTRALLSYWKLSEIPELDSLLLKLGADVPVCYKCVATRLEGIGELLSPLPIIPKVPIVLVNPLKECPTPKVFQLHKGFYAPIDIIPTNFTTTSSFVDFLQKQRNDLYEAAVKIVPDISKLLEILDYQKGCSLARLSGSGGTCFGLFETIEDAQIASRKIASDHPELWVKTGFIQSSF